LEPPPFLLLERPLFLLELGPLAGLVLVVRVKVAFMPLPLQALEAAHLLEAMELVVEELSLPVGEDQFLLVAALKAVWL
jgi:hypothetical protein